MNSKKTTETRVRQLRSALQLTQKEFAELMGIRQNTISSIEKGRTVLTERNMNLLKEKTGVNPDWLLGVTDEPMFLERGSGRESPMACQGRLRVSGTDGAGSLEARLQGGGVFSEERFPKVMQFPDYDFTFVVRGDCMSPKYEAGDEVACRILKEGEKVQPGKTYLVDSAQGVFVRRLYPESGGGFRCGTYNREYEDIRLAEEEVFMLCAVVGMIRVNEG